jgi:carbon-monoxide dehydrogenase small subunit
MWHMHDGDRREPRLACITLVEDCSGASVETVAGLSGAGELHQLQQGLLDHFAAQCGFCTPGMLMAAKALLDANPHPDRGEVEDALSGNICRCEPIISAVLAFSRRGDPTTPGIVEQHPGSVEQHNGYT